MTDIALKYNGSLVADFAVADNDLVTDDGLETAIIISLFTDLEADQSDIDTGLVEDRGGWWGNQLLDEKSKTGSRIWTLKRSKLNSTTLNALQRTCEEALNWLVDDNAAAKIVVSVSRAGRETAAIYIDMYRPNQTKPIRYEYEVFWSM